jgi:uncharacterized membrane protein
VRLKDLDLVGAVIIAVLNVLWALLPGHAPVIGIMLALPLVLVLPGYTLSEALFHTRSLDAPQRVVFSLGLSLATDVLGGLILNLLPAGLKAASWAVFLALLTAVLALVAFSLRRRRRADAKEARWPRLRLTVGGSILWGLALVIAPLAVVYAALSAQKQRNAEFTQLWMLRQVHAGKSCAVRLGVRSFESASVRYLVEMMVNGAVVMTWPSVDLAPQDHWDRVVPISTVGTEGVYIEVRLYRLDRPQHVYRTVHSTLHRCSTSHVAPTSDPGVRRRSIRTRVGT